MSRATIFGGTFNFRPAGTRFMMNRKVEVDQAQRRRMQILPRHSHFEKTLKR